MFTNNINVYQGIIKKKLSDFNDAYSEMVRPLIVKLSDVKIDLSIPQFPFIYEWEEGATTSAEVANRLRAINLSSVARLKLTRRLQSLAKTNPEHSDYVYSTISQIEAKAVPLYQTYLQMCVVFFGIAQKRDEDQEKLTWLQTDLHINGSITKYIEDLTLNQVYKQLDFYQIPDNSDCYFLGKNILCFDEGDNDETQSRKVHWIFAPEAYIKILRALHDIYSELDINNEDFQFISDMTSEYTNGKS